MVTAVSIGNAAGGHAAEQQHPWHGATMADPVLQPRYSNTSLERRTDYVQVVEAFRSHGMRVSTLEELEPALEKAFAAKAKC